MADVLRRKEADSGLLKRIGTESIPALLGAGFALLGKATNEDYLPIIPLAIDFIANMEPYFSKRGLLSLVKYGIGVAAVYADRIFS